MRCARRLKAELQTFARLQVDGHA